MLLKNKAQSLTEYSICLVAVLLAVMTINLYVKRGLQGRHKDAADYAWAKVTEAGIKAIEDDSTLTPDAKNIKKAELLKYSQYEPYYKDSSYTNIMGRKIEGTTIKVGGNLSPGNFKRDLPAVETVKPGEDKPANYMTSAGGTAKETEESIKNALQ